MEKTCIDKLLNKHFNDYKLKDMRTQNKAEYIILMYLMGAIKAGEMTKSLSFLKGSKLTIRKELKETGYYVKNLKLFLYACYCNERTITKKKAALIGKGYLIDKVDIELAKYVKRNKLKRKLSEFRSIRPYPLTLPVIEETLISIYNETKVFSTKFAYRKIKFIMSSSSLTIEDIVSDIQLAGLKAVLVSYPRIENYQHALNIAKRSIHNKGLGLIGRFTRPKRQILFKTRLGEFESKLQHLDFDVQADDDGDDVSNIFVTQLLNCYKNKRRKFVSILAGNFDKEFTDFLNTNKLSVRNNIDLQEYLYSNGNVEKFNHLICKFLDITEAQGKEFLLELRGNIGEKA